MFRAILTYFTEKKIVTLVVLASMMIGFMVVVCAAAVFAPKAHTNDNTHVATMLIDAKRDTWEYTYFDSWKWDNLRTLDGLSA